jgi:hypothetical protein
VNNNVLLIVIGNFIENDCFILDGRVVLKYTFSMSIVSQDMWRYDFAEVVV